jgi:hypothetical protein
LPQITERAAKYVNSPATSYRKGVRSASLPVFYAHGPANNSAHRGPAVAIPSLATMAHTSLFRWVTTLGEDTLPQPKTLRAEFAPAAYKYASAQRRSILIACRTTCSVLLSDQAPVASPSD